MSVVLVLPKQGGDRRRRRVGDLARRNPFEHFDAVRMIPGNNHGVLRKKRRRRRGYQHVHDDDVKKGVLLFVTCEWGIQHTVANERGLFLT